MYLVHLYSISAAYRSFKDFIKLSSLDPKLYAMHSMRIGGATDAFRNNVPLHLIDSQGRWKSGQTKYRYLRVTDVERIVAMKTVYQYDK